MNYERINDNEIEITPGRTPIEIVLESLARNSYTSAELPRSEFLELFDKESDTINLSVFVHLDRSEVLNMDFVNQRNCKLKVRKTDDGKYIFNARSYQRSCGCPETLLDKVKSELEEDCENSPSSARSHKHKSWIGWLPTLLDIVLDFFT